MTFPRPSGRLMFTTPTDLMAIDGPVTIATGKRLRLYEAMARRPDVTPLQLAMATGNSAWFVDRWLQAQARAGYIAFDPSTDSYTLSPDCPPTSKPA